VSPPAAILLSGGGRPTYRPICSTASRNRFKAGPLELGAFP